MKISEDDRQIVIGALNSLGVALANHGHEWTVGERTIYEEAINVLTASSPCRKAADSSALTACAASPPANRSLPACAPISTRSQGLGYFLRRVAATAACRWASKLSHCYECICSSNPSKVCTSYIERANLTVRTHCKRLARLTLAFSKKLENFKAAIALHLAYYNFVKTHGSLRCTPAMEAGIENSAWKVSDLVNAA